MQVSTLDGMHDRTEYNRGDLSAALIGLQSNVAWMVKRWNDGDVEQMAELELMARRHLARVRQLLPAAERAERQQHRRRDPLPAPATLPDPRSPDWAERAAGEQ